MAAGHLSINLTHFDLSFVTDAQGLFPVIYSLNQKCVSPGPPPEPPLNHDVLWTSFPGPWTAEVSSPDHWWPPPRSLLLRPCILSTVMWGGSPPAGRPQWSRPTAGPRGPEKETCTLERKQPVVALVSRATVDTWTLTVCFP